MGKKNKTKFKKQSPAPAAPIPKSIKENRSSGLLWLLPLAIVTFVCFFPILKNNFTNWDDDFYVVNNALLRGPDWAGIFSQGVVSNYHPLTILSLALNYAISGTEAWSYLLFNLLLHVINVMLVFKFIYSISNKKTWVAFLTALVFAIHPMHVESVAWVSERKDVLYTLFFLLSLIQYWKFLQTNKQKHLWFCFLLFVFSLLSKPAAIVLPLVLFLLDYWKQRTFSKKIFLEKIPFLLAAIVFTIVTLKLQSVTAMSSLDQYPIWVRLFFACYVTMIYFIRFFIPYPLSSFHPFPPPDNLGMAVYLSPLFMLFLLFILWRFRKNRLILFSILFFLINIILVMQLISIGFTIVSERYTYVPYIGIAFLIFMMADKYSTQKLVIPFRIVFFAVIGVFCFLSFQRTKVWEDSDSLWTNVIRHYPNAPLARGERAQYIYNKTIQMDPSKTDSLFLDSLYRRVIEDCTVAINNDTTKDASKKGGRSMNYMRGVSYVHFKQYENGLSDFNTCIKINPNDDEILSTRGGLLTDKFGKYDSALLDFNKAIQINPQGRYYLNRSICYYKMGNLTNAKADAQIALQKKANVPDSYRKLLNL